MFFQPFPLPAPPVFPEREVSILDFGATKNALCTEMIAKAISTVHEAGGGRVIIPAGEWHTGPIHMKSHVELYIARGATVFFTEDRSAYLPVVLTNYEGIRCYNFSPMIYGRDLTDVALTGEGRLEGKGPAFWEWSKQTLRGRDKLYAMMRERTPIEKRIFGTEEDALRSPFVQFLNCKNLLIENIYLHNSPFWTIHIVWSENVTVRGVTIENQTNSPNTDGFNIDACRRVLVEDCTAITLGDDMFCIKAGRNEDAWEVGLPCENVVIRNCRGIGKSNSGGIVIGSEMSGSVRNIFAHDCEFEDNLNCIRIKSKDGRGGIVENVDFKNLKMQKGLRGINYTFRYSCEATDAPQAPGKHLPMLRNISAENIFCGEAEQGIAIDGIPNATMQNLHFKDIEINARICLTADTVDGLFMENVRLRQMPD
jgi:polygalacturonase